MSSTLPKLEIQIDENKRLHQELSDSKLLLLAAEKKIDRLENSNKKLKQEILDVSNSIRQEEKIIQQTPVESSGPSEFELLANSREVQIKKLQQERNSLSTLVDSFRLKSTETSETSSSSQSQALKIESLKKSNANLQERLAIIQENHQKFESERSKFKSIIAQELVSVRESHKKTMDKLESDISRVRSERDKAIASLSLQTATNALTTHQQQELRFLANSRRDRIKTLESEISRLKINLAQQMGERGLIEYFCQVDEFDGQEDGLVGGKECRGNPYAQQRLELRYTIF